MPLIYTRCDDLGSFRTANRAIRDAVVNGVARNVSLMAPTDWIEDAAALTRDLPVRFGLHLTITSEWESSRWKPILPRDLVPDLVDADGTLMRTTAEIAERGPVFAQILAECRAQLKRARELGFRIDYVDEHMGFGWLQESGTGPRLIDVLSDWARSEGLLPLCDVPLRRLPAPPGAPGDHADRLLASLARADADADYLVVGHPAYDSEEMRAVHRLNEAPGRVGLDRDAQRRMFMDERILALFGSGRFAPAPFPAAPGGN